MRSSGGPNRAAGNRHEDSRDDPNRPLGAKTERIYTDSGSLEQPTVRTGCGLRAETGKEGVWLLLLRISASLGPALGSGLVRPCCPLLWRPAALLRQRIKGPRLKRRHGRVTPRCPAPSPSAGPHRRRHAFIIHKVQQAVTRGPGRCLITARKNVINSSRFASIITQQAVIVLFVLLFNVQLNISYIHKIIIFFYPSPIQFKASL